MKKLTMLLLVAMLCATCAMGKDGKELNVKDLPDLAQRSLKAYFPGTSVVKVEKDNESVPGVKVSKTFEVTLNDGTQVEFDKNGNWVEVESPQAVPMRLIPGKIVMYLNTNHKGVAVKEIKKTSKAGYEVELANGVELLFDKQFKFIGHD